MQTAYLAIIAMIFTSMPSLASPYKTICSSSQSLEEKLLNPLVAKQLVDADFPSLRGRFLKFLVPQATVLFPDNLTDIYGVRSAMNAQIPELSELWDFSWPYASPTYRLALRLDSGITLSKEGTANSILGFSTTEDIVQRPFTRVQIIGFTSASFDIGKPYETTRLCALVDVAP